MTKSAKRSIIISAILAIIMCASLMAGATLAIFTSESKVNIAVTSGKVDVVATISDGLTLEHKEYSSTTNSYETKAGFWGGSATLDEKAQMLTINNMVPMDKISFSINVKNESSVDVKYRTVIMCEADNGLFEALTVTINSQFYEGRTSVGEWTTLAVGAALETVPVTIEMTEEKGNKYQDKTCTISYKVEAVQGNAQTSDPDETTLEIYTATDLKWFQKNASHIRGIYNKDYSTDYVFSKGVKLMADINLGGAEWDPINWGPLDSSVFDGQGYTVSNFVVKENAECEESIYKNLGLFGKTRGVYIKNLNIDSAIVTGIGRVGAIVGQGEVTKISNCHVANSTIKASVYNDDDGDKAAAIAGQLNEGGSWINDCSVKNCSIYGYRHVGSLVGYLGGANNSIQNNTVGIGKNNAAAPITIYNDRSNNYKKYGDNEFGVNELIGIADNTSNTISDNNFANVTFKFTYPVYNVTSENIWKYLDGEYGTINNATLILAAGNYDKLELGRATEYSGSNTEYHKGYSVADDTKVTYDVIKPYTSGTRTYKRTLKNVTIKAAEGATVNVSGFDMWSAHVYTEGSTTGHDDVIDYAITSTSDSCYQVLNVNGLYFENINFTAKCDVVTSLPETTINDVKFTGCKFTTGGITSTNGAAVRFYNNKGVSTVTNLTVEGCTFTNCYQGVLTYSVNGITVNNCKFDTTGHNAIAIQNEATYDHGAVVITKNTFTNIGDRIIRFGYVGANTQITIQGNTATNSGDVSGDGKVAIIKAQSLADGITYTISGNNWGSENAIFQIWSGVADQPDIETDKFKDQNV